MAKCIHRRNMPQIDQEDMQEFLGWIGAQGVKWSHDLVVLSAIRPVQCCKEITDHWVPHPQADIPLLISKDFYLLDGNHRWYTLKHEREFLAATITIRLPYMKALNLARDFPKSYFADEHNQRVQRQTGQAHATL